MGRLLGPRGNSLKRVEATTGCRVYIRGKGSIKDPDKVRDAYILCFLTILTKFCSYLALICLLLGRETEREAWL